MSFDKLTCCRVLQRQRRDAVYIERHQRSWLPTLEVEDGWCERGRETKTSYDLPFSFDKACCVSLLRWLLFPWGIAHQLMLFFCGAELVWWTLCCDRYCSPSFNISSSLISVERSDKPWELVVINHCVHTLCHLEISDNCILSGFFYLSTLLPKYVACDKHTRQARQSRI